MIFFFKHFCSLLLLKSSNNCLQSCAVTMEMDQKINLSSYCIYSDESEYVTLIFSIIIKSFKKSKLYVYLHKQQLSHP